MPFTISHILQRQASSRITRGFITQRTHTASKLPELSNISLTNTKFLNFHKLPNYKRHTVPTSSNNLPIDLTRNDVNHTCLSTKLKIRS